MIAGEWKTNQANTILFVLVDEDQNELPGLGTSFNIFISKAGSSFAAGAGTKTEIGHGWYKYVSTEAEADTPGTVAVYITGTNVLQQNLEYVVGTRVIDAIDYTYTLISTINGHPPIVGATVWITTDTARTQVVWVGTTDAFGVARDIYNELPLLEPGRYYFWRLLSGYTFRNPDRKDVG